MSTISSLNNSSSKYSLDEFDSKIQKVYEDLNTGKMWLNTDCETVKKNSKIVRFIKAILSIILPLNLYSGIKADKVAMNFFKMVEANKDHLKCSSTKDNVVAIFSSLDAATKKRYTDLYYVLTLATEQLFANCDKNSLLDDIEPSDNDSVGSFDFSDKPSSSSPIEIGSVNSNLINQSLGIMSNDDDEAQVALSSDREYTTSAHSTNELKKRLNNDDFKDIRGVFAAYISQNHPSIPQDDILELFDSVMDKYKEDKEILNIFKSMYKKTYDFLELLESKNLDSRAGSLDDKELEEIKNSAEIAGVSCEYIKSDSIYDFYKELRSNTQTLKVIVEFINKKLL